MQQHFHQCRWYRSSIAFNVDGTAATMPKILQYAEAVISIELAEKLEARTLSDCRYLGVRQHNCSPRSGKSADVKIQNALKADSCIS